MSGGSGQFAVPARSGLSDARRMARSPRPGELDPARDHAGDPGQQAQGRTYLSYLVLPMAPDSEAALWTLDRLHAGSPHPLAGLSCFLHLSFSQPAITGSKAGPMYPVPDQKSP